MIQQHMNSSQKALHFPHFALCFVIVFLVSGCGQKIAAPEHVMRPQVTESILVPDVKQALESYIQGKYGWERSRFVIQFQKEEDDLDVYFIGCRVDSDPIRVGGGKSFYLYFNRATFKVVREMHMQ